MYHLFIATPEKVLFDGMVNSVNVPGAAGYFEVLQNHAPIIASLTKGKLVIKDQNNKKTSWSITGGIFEFSKNEGALLADSETLILEDSI